MAWPKSGCRARKATSTKRSPNEINLPGGPATSVEAAISHAETMTKPGLRNSDGWKDTKPNEYQRIAPLPKSVPRRGRQTKAKKATAKPITPARRIALGDRSEKPNIVAKATAPKAASRCT